MPSNLQAVPQDMARIFTSSRKDIYSQARSNAVFFGLMTGAAKALRSLLEEPTGNFYIEDETHNFTDTVEVFGFALVDYAKEAMVNTGGTRHMAELA